MTNMQQQIEALEKTIEQLNKKVSYLERVVEKLIDTAWVKEEKIDDQRVFEYLQSKLSDYE
jgi:flagellar biosynthesis chaperone FliJ